MASVPSSPREVPKLELTARAAKLNQGIVKCSQRNFQDGPRLLVTSDELMGLLREKLSFRFRSVRESFQRFDANVSGFIEDHELRDMIVSMGLDMTAQEYLQFYRHFDPSGNKKISYYEWNNIVGNLIHPLSDISISRPDTPKLKEWTRRALQRGLSSQIEDVDAAFNEINMCQSGLISHQEFLVLLRKLNVPFGDDEETFYVFKKFQDKATNPSGQMSKADFFRFYNEFTKTKAVVANEMPGLSLESIKSMFVTKMFNKYNAVNKAFRVFRGKANTDGSTLTYDDIRRAFTDLNIAPTAAQFKELCAWFDPSNNGFVTYVDFNKVIGPIILPNSKDTSDAMVKMETTSGAQDGLTFNPSARLGNNRPFEEREKDRMKLPIVGKNLKEWCKDPQPTWEEYAKSFRGTEGFSPIRSDESSEGFQAPAIVERIERTEVAVAAPVTAPPAPVAPVDVNKLEERMRKALGRGWVHAAADIKKSAGTGRLLPETVRDILAERAVPMTSREAAALAQRYGAPTGGIDADKMLQHVFKAPFAGAAPTKTARIAVAAMTATSTAKPAPSAFVKGATAKTVSIF